MRGASFAGDRVIEFIDVTDPTPDAGEVVLEMKASGICGSDLHAYKAPRASLAGRAPVIGGHEPCGVVVACGPGVRPAVAKPGDRVMVHHYYGCGACRHCRTGWSQMCDQQAPAVYGFSAHGGHAPYLKVPAATLVHLPDELSFEAGAAISCGTGTAYAALKRLGVSGGDNVTIFGQGPVGLAATQLAYAMGARVIALDISDERLRMAKGFGADVTIDSNAVDPVAAIREATGGRGADLSVEASGAEPARAAAIESLTAWGTCAFVGIGSPAPAVRMDKILQKQITVFASWTFSTIGQADCADFAVRKNVPVDQIFTGKYPLDQASEAYVATAAQAGGKGVFTL
jgi:threonine dehydrogenase-like Zn-dependent dehydrogenase